MLKCSNYAQYKNTESSSLFYSRYVIGYGLPVLGKEEGNGEEEDSSQTTGNPNGPQEAKKKEKLAEERWF